MAFPSPKCSAKLTYSCVVSADVLNCWTIFSSVLRGTGGFVPLSSHYFFLFFRMTFTVFSKYHIKLLQRTMECEGVYLYCAWKKNYFNYLKMWEDVKRKHWYCSGCSTFTGTGQHEPCTGCAPDAGQESSTKYNKWGHWGRKNKYIHVKHIRYKVNVSRCWITGLWK